MRRQHTGAAATAVEPPPCRAGRTRGRPACRAGTVEDRSAGLLEALVDLLPVDDVPPRLQVLRTPVLVAQVVGVLPDVVAHDRVMTFHHGVVLVGRAHDLELAVLGPDQPHPPAAETLRASVVEAHLKRLERAEVAV